jgi:dienelactone hydrolase
MNIQKFIIINLLLIQVSFLEAQDSISIDVKYFPAQSDSKNVAIFMLAGSEGGYPNTETDFYTKRGFSLLEIAYFGTDNTPKMLEMIPMEYFEKVLSYYISLPEIHGKKIVVIGSSKGAELALLLASRYKDIQGVIAKVPSSVVFQGIGGMESSWSYKGDPIPFVPYVEYDFANVKNYEFLEMYQLSLKNKSACENASIPVEKINGPILLFSGKEDKLWPSSEMSEMIIGRLKDKNFKYSYEHIAYANAGHTLNEFFMLGGTFEGNQKARNDYNERVMMFLDKLAKE